MSHTITGFRRLAAGVAVAAGVTATTLLGAAPAFAQSTTVTAAVSNGSLRVTGTSFGDVITATGGNGTVTLSNLTGSITDSGAGCTQLGASVRCTGVSFVRFTGSGGADKFDNRTNTNSLMIGGSGNDILLGGSGQDQANGSTGVDTCTAEVETSCER